MEFRSRFSPHMRVSPSVGTGGAKQSFKNECDINLILGKYAKGQVIDHLAKWQGSYGFAPALTFQEAMNAVRRAEEMFGDLDSAIRKRFSNDPAEFLAFAQNPENIEEMRKLGLAPSRAPAAAPPPPAAPGAVSSGAGGAVAPPAAGAGNTVTT